MEIAICGVKELPQHMSWATHILSLRGAGDAKLFWEPPAVTMHFDDVSDPADPGCPTLNHIHRIAIYGKMLPDDARLLVHCAAGLSRSPAAALCILMARGMNYTDALDRVMKIRPQAQPNGLMIALVKKEFGLGAEDYEELIELSRRLENIDI